jgi:hypothetical protein
VVEGAWEHAYQFFQKLIDIGDRVVNPAEWFARNLQACRVPYSCPYQGLCKGRVFPVTEEHINDVGMKRGRLIIKQNGR